MNPLPHSPASKGPGQTHGIQPLPEPLASQMAAGQVVDSLAAAVRELVENALDAQATRITVQLWPQAGRLQVADNGLGLSLSDLQRAATPHSTSKIYTEPDLWQVSTLGFRGQALHSLAQVGDLCLWSRTAGETGWQVTYSHQGEPLTTTPVAMAPGTIATLTQLFFAWPGRRPGLTPLSRQRREVQRVIYHAALCHPQVTWQVVIDDRPWLALTPSPSPRDLLPQMLPAVTAADLRESLDPGRCYGLIGLPDRYHRPRPDWLKLAINGRVVTLPEFEVGLLQAFRHTLPRHRYPLGLIHLRLPPDQVDWHRSPDKSMVYLQQLDTWLDQARRTIEDLLGPAPGPGSLPQGPKASETQGDYGWLEASSVNLSDPLLAPSPAPTLRALAQVHQRYILAEQSDGLCLIEQHIAHERVIYEQLQDTWQLVSLPGPLVLEGLTMTQVEHLQQLGLEVENFGPQGWLVRTAPAPLIQRHDLADALIELSGSGDLEKALVAVACRTAIRNGAPLSLPEMQRLLQDWQGTQYPRTCPHGRPICLTLKETSLARFFKRHWVIGKSHGI